MIPVLLAMVMADPSAARAYHDPQYAALAAALAAEREKK